MNMMTKMRPAKTASITSEVVTVTPEMAKTWLELNTKNRPKKNRGINRYSQDMKDGAWQLTGDAIRFSSSGKLLDGQNRLKACVKADCNFETFVMYGFADETQDVMDNGINRTIVDTLTLRGITNAGRVGPSLRALCYYKVESTIFSRETVSKSQTIATLDAHPNITKSVGRLTGLPPGLPLAAIGFLSYAATYLMGKSEEDDRMMTVLKTGIPSYPGDPIHAFREKMLHVGSRQNDVKYQTEHIAWTLYHAFNLFCKGESATASFVRILKRPVEIIGLDRKKL